MTFLTYLTTALQDYAPLSYGVAASFGIIAMIVILRGAISIWISFSQRLTTKKATYIEYKINSRRSNLVKKSNIYQEPSFSLLEKLTPESPAPDLNRNQKRTIKATQPASPQVVKLKQDECLSAQILVLFEKPIASSSMHIKIESISGNCPTIEFASNNERWASVAISNIYDGCYFRISFNDIEEEKK